MFDLESYISTFVSALQLRFADRLVYVGLQGSYQRGEETESSDLDLMVVISDLTPADLDAYRAVINALPIPDKSCGFICSKTDLENWNTLEICHLVHTTKDYFGKLDALVPAYTEYDVRSFVKMSVGNLYHELCHRYLHSDQEKNIRRLPGTYKGVFFILQNMHYLSHGQFLQTKAQLLQCLSGLDREVLACSMQLSRGENYDFEACFSLLFTWCQKTLAWIS